ncbi:hypothetical protein [Priestia koreensis]|uniref:Uncharacterized protein n=1 Tax=Priestia koreensis TaxID=284581 RepID=A0A0M0KWF7_9BACI|nr:hypothetical protein [Priestia koreensis]KOO42723.1 hypothetical protein AMD01_16380 [Priestia koreensis]MCM3005533.1 hypothetical protein [Priestia koreensis]
MMIVLIEKKGENMRKLLVLTGASLLLSLTACTETTSTKQKQTEIEETENQTENKKSTFSSIEEISPFRDIQSKLYGFWATGNQYIIIHGNNKGDMIASKEDVDPANPKGIRGLQIAEFYLLKQGKTKFNYIAKLYPPGNTEFPITFSKDYKQVTIQFPSKNPITYLMTDASPEEYFFK